MPATLAVLYVLVEPAHVLVTPLILGVGIVVTTVNTLALCLLQPVVPLVSVTLTSPVPDVV